MKTLMWMILMCGVCVGEPVVLSELKRDIATTCSSYASLTYDQAICSKIDMALKNVLTTRYGGSISNVVTTVNVGSDMKVQTVMKFVFDNKPYQIRYTFWNCRSTK